MQTNDQEIQIAGLERSFPKEKQESALGVLKSTLISYKNKPDDQPLAEWVESELRKYPEDFSKEEAKAYSKEIVEYSQRYTKTRDEIEKRVENGDRAEYANLNIIKNGVNFADTNQFNGYIKGIDDALQKANETVLNVYVTQSGEINQNPQLHGFVAEEHHVNSFNIEAAQQGSKYRAQMLQNTNKNSVDIVIRDTTTGKIEKKYSVKYGQSAEDTQKYFEKGDYRGQRKLVPTEQKDKIDGATDRIESPDGVKSKPLTRDEAKRVQKEAQEEQKIRNYDWEKTSTVKIAKHVAKETTKNIIFSSLMSGAYLIGKRAYEVVFKGKDYTRDDLKRDFKAWFDSTKEGAKSIGLKSAIGTGLTICVRKGYLPMLSKSTPISVITGIVHVGMENAKIMYKMAKGEIGFKEGMKQMGITTSSTIAGLALGAKGATIGAEIGTIFGPVGVAIGGFLGGVAGSVAGSEVVTKVVEGAKTVYNKAKNVVVSAYNSVKSVATATVSSISNAVSSAISSVASAVSSAANAVSNAISSVASAVASFFS